MNLASSIRRGHSRRSGFTMIEIAICLGVIGFALVAIIGVLPIGMNVQKDNREETVINFDANYLMSTLRSGVQGPFTRTLTNYIVCITNYYTVYDFTTVPASVKGTGVNWYNTFTNIGQPAYYSVNGGTHTTPFLTNDANIVGLLTIPKFTPDVNGIRSNYISADFRSITGSPMDHGGSQSSKDFAFSYRLFPEITPVGVGDFSLTNWNLTTIATADRASRFANATYLTNLQANLSEIRLNFRWPLLPSGATGPSGQLYRSSVSGRILALNTVPTLYFFQSQSYTNGTQILPW